MGDRIAVLKDGVLQQVGTPRELYADPKNVFVAGFIGSPAMNLFPADVVPGGVRFGSLVVPVEAALLKDAGAQVTIGVRPEDVEISNVPEAGLTVHVDIVEELGADGYLYGTAEQAGTSTEVVARVDGRTHPSAGDTVYIQPKPAHVHIFNLESGERIGGAIVD